MLLLQFLDRIFILVIQIFWHDDFDQDVLIALLLAARNAAALDAEFCTAAGAGGHREVDGAVECWDFDLCAEQGFIHADGQIEVDVQTLSAKKGMGLDFDDNVEIAWFAAGLLPASPDANSAAVLHARWNLDFDCFDVAIAIDLQRECGAARSLVEFEDDVVFDVLSARR